MILYSNIQITYIIFHKKKVGKNIYISYKIIKTSQNIGKFISIFSIFNNFY